MAEADPPKDLEPNSTAPADAAKLPESTDPPSSEPESEKAAAPESASSAKSEPEEASADATAAATSPPTSAPAKEQPDSSTPDVTGSSKLAEASDNPAEAAENTVDSLQEETPPKTPSDTAATPPPENGGGEAQAKSDSTAAADGGTEAEGDAPESAKAGPNPEVSSKSGSKTSSRVSIVAGSASKSKSGDTANITDHPSTQTNNDQSPASAAETKAATPPESKKASRASVVAGSGTGSKQGSVVTITEGKRPDSGRMSRHSISVASQASASRRLSSAKKETRVDNSSMTERLYSNQINSGNHNKLTSVVFDKYGNKKLVHPGSVGRCHTVDISLAGMARTQRPMPQEQCRKGEHNCFTKKDSRLHRSAPSVMSFGQYPDFMKMNKLNEFVAASIIEKLRLKGLALPLHDYHGRNLPSSILAELVLQPTKKKVTDRYYFGYVPPPNRPRFNAAFRHYMQQFKKRHSHPESDINYGVALEHVRVLADLQQNDQPLSKTLAEVVRAQEEPGFGTRQFRRPQSAAI